MAVTFPPIENLEKAEKDLVNSLTSLPATTHEAFLTLCGSSMPTEFSGEHFVPAHQDSKANGTVFTFTSLHTWHTLEDLGRELGVKNSILCATPHIWQIEPFVHDVARTFNVPTTTVPPNNLPLARLFSEEVGVDIIVTTPALLAGLRVALLGAPKPKAIVLVHTDAATLPHTQDNDDDDEWTTLHELHLVPGFVLAFQNVQLATEGDPHDYYLADSCLWEFDENNARSLITARQPAAVPFVRLELPCIFKPKTSGVFSLQI